MFHIVRSKNEALAVLFAQKHFRHYLLAEPFLVYSDHQALRSTFRKRDSHGRLACWLDLLSECRFEIRHVAGKRNSAADYLSRSIEEAGEPGQIISDEIENYLENKDTEDKPEEMVILMTVVERPLETALQKIKNYIATGKRKCSSSLAASGQFICSFEGVVDANNTRWALRDSAGKKMTDDCQCVS